MDLQAPFSANAPHTVRELLQEAAASYHDTPRATALLWQAHTFDPECLAVYFALYKFYFYKRQLEDAERAVRLALETAARQGGFSKDWTCLSLQSAPWSDVQNPAHFYLFSLKALAFIRLRRGDAAAAGALLTKLSELDPFDSVGGSVIRDLAAGSG